MIMTVLEATVDSDQADVLLAAYRDAIGNLDDGIERTYLTRDVAQRDRWQILTLWRDREALEAMRRTGETPRGLLIFRAAGAEPQLALREVVAQARRPDPI
jgi:heme-degrading monooxygenase HmoA